MGPELEQTPASGQSIGSSSKPETERDKSMARSWRSHRAGTKHPGTGRGAAQPGLHEDDAVSCLVGSGGTGTKRIPRKHQRPRSSEPYSEVAQSSGGDPEPPAPPPPPPMLPCLQKGATLEMAGSPSRPWATSAPSWPSLTLFPDDLLLAALVARPPRCLQSEQGGELPQSSLRMSPRPLHHSLRASLSRPS